MTKMPLKLLLLLLELEEKVIKDEKPQKGKNTIKKEDIKIVLIKEKVQNQRIEVEEPYKTKTEVITKTKTDKKRIEDDDHHDGSETIHVRRSVRNKYKSKK